MTGTPFDLSPSRFRVARAGLQKRLARSLSLVALVSATLMSLFTACSGSAADTKKNEPVLTEDNEIKIGRENAEENDKQVKLVTDAALLERVNRIGSDIAEIANKIPIPAKWGSPQVKQFHYTFKIVDEKDINAYSLPGGFIYVNKGLLDYVRSDDELAGVLAHEISHAAHHHMVKLMHEQNKINNILIPALVAVLAASKANAADAGHLLIASQLYNVAKINTYGIEAEKDADHTGIVLLTHTKYNPVGLYSFMLRLAVDERNHSYGEMGIYQTHPPGKERAEAARAFLDAQHIPIRLSDVDPTLLASVSPAPPKKDSKGATIPQDVVEIKVSDVVLCRVVGADGQTATQRAQKMAKQLNVLMDSQIQPFEVRLNRERTRIMIRNVPFLSEADAAAQDKTLEDLVHDIAAAVTQISQKQQLESGI